MKGIGTHILIELYGCDFDLLNDAALIKREMVRAAEIIRATVISSHAHTFEPHGVSAVVIIAESHLTMHTWPEHGYAAVDLFICTNREDPGLAVQHLQKILQADQVSVTEIKRGILAGKDKS